MAAVRKARKSEGVCVVCGRCIKRGQLIETWGGYLRHSACQPPKDDPYGA